jgi:hypothetical protein
MHKSRIIISVIPKIMINSQDVYFDIKRQCAQVELQNKNIISKKNHLGSFYSNGKQFVQQDPLHNFVQYLAQELVITQHTTYPKLRYRGAIDLKLRQI